MTWTWILLCIATFRWALDPLILMPSVCQGLLPRDETALSSCPQYCSWHTSKVVFLKPLLPVSVTILYNLTNKHMLSVVFCCRVEEIINCEDTSVDDKEIASSTQDNQVMVLLHGGNLMFLRNALQAPVTKPR